MYTNQMRVTGLSGLDTESMVKQLMKAESMKLVSIRKSRELNVWKQEQYRDAAKVLQTFQDSFLTFGKANNLKSNATFKDMTTLVKLSGTETASTAISVATTEDTRAGNHKLKIEQVATRDVWRGTNAVGGTIRGTEAADFGGIRAGDSFHIALDGRSSEKISFDVADIAQIQDSQSFADVLNRKLKALGTETRNGSIVNKVSASVDAAGKLRITAGPGHTAIVSGGSRTANRVAATAAPDTGTDRTINFDVNIHAVTTSLSVAIGAGDDAQTIAAAINEQFDDERISDMSVITRGGVLSFVNTYANDAVALSGADLQTLGFGQTVTLENADVFSVLGIDAGSSTNLNMKSSLASAFGVSGTVSFKIDDQEFKMDSTYTVERMMSLINASDTNATMTYDSLKGTFSIASKGVGARNALKLTDPDGFLTNVLGLVNTESAQDAIITLNGVSTTRETNDFTIENMRIKLTDEAVGKEFALQINKDTAKTVDTIKKFVEEYNKLVDALKKSYATRRPKSDKYSYYEPLSEEEKDALSEKELEKYEAKAKEGLLYRDSILTGIAGAMRTMLYEPLTLDNGEKISLYEIGITTEKDRKGGVGRIELDETKLTKAIAERGDHIVELFTKASDVSYADKANRGERRRTEGIAYRIEDIIRDAVGANGSIYNKAGILETKSVIENELHKTISAQDQKISDMLKTLARKEENYYAMFAKLENAMNQANSQTAALQSLLGA